MRDGCGMVVKSMADSSASEGEAFFLVPVGEKSELPDKTKNKGKR